MLFPTKTSDDQEETEAAVFQAMMDGPGNFLFHEHVKFLSDGLEKLPRSFSSLDASRPWFVFWASHALDLLDSFDEKKFPGQRVSTFLSKCQSLSGGFGGGPFQLPHLAPTYASVCAVVIANQPELVDRYATWKFILSLKSPSGGFRMHDGGETDMRGTYCAIAVASMLEILTPEITNGVAGYVLSCQTFEGGIAGDAGGLEAHGGYGYCGLAALGILSRHLGVDFFMNIRDRLQRMLWWVSQRQMTAEGGFNGRANKLVDSCYSFWQGASLVILRDLFIFAGLPVPTEPGNFYWCNAEALDKYVVSACQCETGGLRDKPGKSPDYYHSCYALSGLAVIKGKTHALYNVRPERLSIFRENLRKLPILGFSGHF